MRISDWSSDVCSSDLVSLECVTNNRDEVIQESVDLLYNWIVLLSEMGIRPAEVWHEMERREAEYGMAGKLPKSEGGDGGRQACSGKKKAGYPSGARPEIGSTSCRERGWKYGELPVV